MKQLWCVPFFVALLAFSPAALAQSSGHVTGVGGIFFRSKDPKALLAWYRDVLGLKVEDWGGVVMPSR